MVSKTKGQFLLNQTATRLQFGALCWRVYRSEFQVLLVTSRDTGRWIIPKGWPIDGLTSEAAAAQEAWEEAGVVGAPSTPHIGTYAYDKLISPARPIPCLVHVFPLQVHRLRDKYPESHQRRRKWFSPAKAATKVDEPELRLLVASFRAPVDPLSPALPAEKD